MDKNKDFWNDIVIIVEDELHKLRRLDTKYGAHFCFLFLKNFYTHTSLKLVIFLPVANRIYKDIFEPPVNSKVTYENNVITKMYII